MPASYSAEDISTSGNVLLDALQEMDAIIAESKLCLDSMSSSTTTPFGTPRRNGHGDSSENDDVDSTMSKSSSASKINGHGSLPGNLSKLWMDMPSELICFPKVNGYKSPPEKSPNLLQLAEDMKFQIQRGAYDMSVKEARDLPRETRRILTEWLQEADEASHGGGSDHLSDAVKRLEAERSSLQMKLALLSEQTNDQTEKIHELLDLLLEKTCQLESTEALLREEMLSRSALETRKLDLLTEVKDMRSQMKAAEQESNNSPRVQPTHLLKSGSADYLNGTFQSPSISVMMQLHSDLEQEKLKKTVQLLTVQLDEKDRKIQQLEDALKCQKTNGMDNSHRANDLLPMFDDSRDGGRKPPVIIRSTVGPSHGRKMHPLAMHNLIQNSSIGSDDSLTKYAESTAMSDGNGRSPSINGSRRRESSSRLLTRAPRSRSSDARTARSSESSPRHMGSFHFSSLSSSKSLSDKISLATSLSTSLGLLRQRSCSNGGGGGREVNRCSSVPNLGRLGGESDRQRCSTPKSGSSEDKKHSGLRKFFEKFTRSNSYHLNEDPTGSQFKRGGVRATAGPRLQNTNSLRRKWGSNTPMKNWSQEMVVQWLEEDVQIPLSPTGKSWIINGDQFQKASPYELEKELNLYHPLHKRKLLLALKAQDEQDSHPMGKLDYLWVMRWLDDVGLPQYKEVFAEARIDGRMLNYLTIDDLFLLKITNALHHASIKRGIQILRHCNYDPSYIKRRPTKSDSPVETPDAVVFWSDHRVMEWLRALDLSEYGPNLRGSGVHGALMILEERFNADVLAELLAIPQSKTLLRRHLSKSFTELVGNEIIRQKRATEAAPGFVPLSPHLKLKPLRKGFSLVRRRGKLEAEMTDYVCPMDLKVDFSDIEIKRQISQENGDDAKENQTLLKACSQNSVPSLSSLSPVDV